MIIGVYYIVLRKLPFADSIKLDKDMLQGFINCQFFVVQEIKTSLVLQISQTAVAVRYCYSLVANI